MISARALPYTTTRLAAVGMTSLSVFMLHPVTWLNFYNSLLLGHYVLAAMYSQRPLSRLLTSPRGRTALTLALFGGVALSILEKPFILFYFGLHLAISEGFFSAPKSLGNRHTKLQPYLLARTAFSFCCYLFMIRRDPSYPQMYTPEITLVLSVACLVSGGVMVRLMLQIWTKLSREDRADQILFEMSLVCLVIASIFVPVQWNQLIFFHIMTWLLIPLPRLAETGKGKVAFFGFNTILVTLLLLGLSPKLGWTWSQSYEWWERQIVFWGYIHISLSFVLSETNPNFVKRLYQPQPS